MAIKKVVTYLTGDGQEWRDKASAEKHEQHLSECSKVEIRVVVVQELEQIIYRTIANFPKEIEKLKKDLIKEYESKFVRREDIHYWGMNKYPKVISVTIKDK